MVSVVTRHKPPCFEDHQGLVYKIANQFTGQGLPFDDLVQEGHIGLLSAIRSFDSALGFAFTSYAMPLIRWRMISALSRERKQYMAQLDDTPGPADPRDDIDAIDSRLDLESTLDRAQLTADERDVLEQWLGVDEGAKSCRAIGRCRGVTKQRVHQIVTSAIEKIELLA